MTAGPTEDADADAEAEAELELEDDEATMAIVREIFFGENPVQ